LKAPPGLNRLTYEVKSLVTKFCSKIWFFNLGQLVCRYFSELQEAGVMAPDDAAVGLRTSKFNPVGPQRVKAPGFQPLTVL
jgi:hypothetical protein